MEETLVMDANTFDTLNDAQQHAVFQLTGPMLVLAGAGSGKTRVLTHKISFAIAQGALPAEILAVTFTNKAARQMNERVESLLGCAKGYLDSWIGTFHSICCRILRRDIQHYQSQSGYRWSNNFVIYDETDSINAVKEAIKRLELDDKLYNPKTIRYQISNLKNQRQNSYQYASQATDFRTEKIARIYDTYESILSTNNALDFDDLLLKCVELFDQCPEVLDKYHRRFRHILVDEFQDTNDVQYEWVRMIAEGVPTKDRQGPPPLEFWQDRGLTVVGDVDQSIYSWRGANFRIILNFQSDYSNAELVKLEHNYRSTANILSLANAIIENNEQRLPKSLISVQGEGPKIRCYEAKDDRDEAYYVVSECLKLVDTGKYKAGECCVLYRTNAQSRVLEDVLISRGIPYSVLGGTKFYERREIRDVLAYLTVLFNDQDAYSVKRVINVPKRGIGKTTLEKIEARALENTQTFYETLKHIDDNLDITGKTRNAIKGFVTLVENMKSQIDTLPLDELILALIEQSGYMDELRLADPLDSEGRIQNVEEFVSVAKHYLLDTPDGDLAGFLTQMALLSDIDSAESADNKLTLMTIHSAKGLEFPVVVVAGLEEGLFPHGRALTDADQMEEERRLMYVAVTRAEKELMITYSRRRMVFGELKYASPSRFLKEAPPDLLTGFYTLDTEESRDREGTWTRSERWKNDDDDWNNGEDYQSGRRRGGYGSGYGSSSSGKVPIPKTPIRSSKPAIKPGGSARPLSSSQARASSSGPVTILPVGSRVNHAKFGDGTIEQVLGQGDKAIYSIQFDGIQGKKLLDPKIAQLNPL